MGVHDGQLLVDSHVIRGRVSRRRLVFVLVGILMGMFLSALQQTIVSPGMPRIIAELNGMQHYAWAFTAYMLTSTASIPIWGKLSDLYGRRPFYLAGLSLFLAGSALCGAAQDFTQLIIFRGVQGLGGGAAMTITQAIIGDVFTPIERGKWQGVIMAAFGTASVTGPIAGGWITDNLGWRWLFYVNLPLGILVVVISGLALPRLDMALRRPRIDYGGALLLVASVVPMLLAFSWAGSVYAWGSLPIVGLLVASALVGATFIWYEALFSEPIISPGLFRSSIFAISMVVNFLVSAGTFGAVSYIPLFIQGVINQTATNSGILLTPMMLGFIVSSTVGGQLMSRTGRYKMICIACLTIVTVGTLLLLGMDTATTNGVVSRNMAIVGLGMGAPMSLFIVVVQNAFPFSKLGTVTSSLQFFRQIGNTMGVAIMGSVMISRFSSGLAERLPAQVQVLPAERMEAIGNPQILLSPEATEKARQSFVALGPQGKDAFDALLEAMRQALGGALSEVFLLGLAMLVLALLVSFFLKEIPLRTSHQERPDNT